MLSIKSSIFRFISSCFEPIKFYIYSSCRSFFSFLDSPFLIVIDLVNNAGDVLKSFIIYYESSFFCWFKLEMKLLSISDSYCPFYWKLLLFCYAMKSFCYWSWESWVWLFYMLILYIKLTENVFIIKIGVNSWFIIYLWSLSKQYPSGNNF